MIITAWEGGELRCIVHGIYCDSFDGTIVKGLLCRAETNIEAVTMPLSQKNQNPTEETYAATPSWVPIS